MNRNFKLMLFSTIGGKQKCCQTYLEKISAVPHKTYIEAFAGAATICINKPKKPAEVLNDRDEQRAILLKALSAEREVTSRLVEELNGSHYCKACFDKAYEAYTEYTKDNPSFESLGGDRLAALGASIYQLMSMSFGGKITGKYHNPDSGTCKSYESRLYMLPEIIHRLNGVTVLNEDGVSVAERFKDDETAFIFMDPPYLSDDTNKNTQKRSVNSPDIYKYSVDWNALINMIVDARCKIMLCSYNSDVLNKELVGRGWRKLIIDENHAIDLSMKKGSNHRNTSTEYVYVNY